MKFPYRLTQYSSDRCIILCVNKSSGQSPNDDKQPHDLQRRRGRMMVEELTCHHDQRCFGHIVDLSTSGMKVLRKKPSKIKPGDLLLMTIVGCGHEIRVKIKVKWADQIESKQILFGMEFLLMSDQTQEAVHVLCQLARIDTHLGIHRKPA